MERKINMGLAAVAAASIGLMVVLSIDGLNERAKAREIASLPVVKMEPVTIVGDRQLATTQVARTAARTQVR